MKYLLILLLTLSANVLATPTCETNPNNPNCSGDYPGYTPDWDSRWNVTCSMSEADTGIVRATSMTGGLDYAQGGSLYAYTVNSVRDWYNDLAEMVGEQGGIDTRLLPQPDSPLTRFIAIEADLIDR